MQVLGSLARAYDFDLDTPWKRPARGGAATSSSTAPAAARSPCASSTAARATRSRSRSRASSATSTAACCQTESAWMREELSQLPGARSRARPATAPASSPSRWRSRSPARTSRMSSRRSRRRRARLVRRARRASSTAHPERDRPRHPQGDQRAPRLPPQCRARLSQPRPHQRHAVGRREPAHPPRQPDRHRPVGRALRPRRALDRPPPEGQRPPARNAQAPARPRQHRAGGRA